MIDGEGMNPIMEIRAKLTGLRVGSLPIRGAQP